MLRLTIIFSLCFSLAIGYAQTFIDKSTESDFSTTGIFRGVSIGDYNGDGLEDIYVSRKDGANLLYRNDGNFQFTEVAESLGLSHNGRTQASLWIDYDKDGDVDLFMANSIEACKIFRNEGGSFTEVTRELLPYTVGNIQSVNAVDYDNDGYLDIYLARFLEENILLRNEKGKRFSNAIFSSGIRDAGPSMGAVFFDYDNDGDQDLYQVRDSNAGNLMFRNDGGQFTDVTAITNSGYEGQGMGVDVADVNQDGQPDLYFSNLYENVLLLQKEDNSFEQYQHAELEDRGMGWGTLFMDSNNNSRKDIFVANDSHFLVDQTNHPNKLILNQKAMNFYAPSMNAHFQNTHASYGAATADFDNDGRMDLFVCNSVSESNQVFQNQSTKKNYLQVALQGIKSNSQAIGAKVVLYNEGKSYSSTIIAGHSYVSQSASRVHFGLDQTTELDSLVVHWPSGLTQVLTEISPNQLITITENYSPAGGGGKLVWTTPDFPTQTDDITLYFDAKEGNAGLQDFDGDVYMHAGVITNKSTSLTDWKFVQGTWGVANSKTKMNADGDDIYSISYNITDFYGIPSGEIVEQLAFVFRNADGSKSGRDEDGGDIYLEVFPANQGLLVDLISPADNNTILIVGEELEVVLKVNKTALVTIQDQGAIIYSGTTEELTLPIIAEGLGAHELKISVEDSAETILIDRTYFVIDQNETLEDPPSGIVNGINYRQGSYIFQLTAPDKQHVFLLCPANDYSIDSNFQLKKSTDELTYWIELPRSLFNNGTTYQYLVDGNLTIADPFSSLVLDPSHDNGIPADVQEELPSYPANAKGIVTAFDETEPSYDWTVTAFDKPAKTDLVIYEIMMWDFLRDKNYKSLLDTLDYLADLGINAIELMPISEFEGNQSWGYNPSFHMAVDKYYGSRNQLKAVIDACHQRGIAVILDVVFNHAFSQSPLCQLYWDAGAFRPTADSPYLNPEAKHPYNVGYDFNHESPYTKQWVKQVLAYWIEEFQFDGFRFDLSKGLTQKFSGTNGSLMSQYDQSRVNILKDYSDYIWSLDPTSYVIMEHFADNSEEKVLSDHGMMLWGNLTHQFAEAAMGFRSDLEWADYTVRDWSDPNLIAYMESHDEERMGYKLKNFGDATGNYNTRELAIGMERIAAASAIYFSIPGPKMLWQFGELGYDNSINRCTNGSISDNCRLDPKPILWNYFEEEPRHKLYDKLAAMLYLKTNFPVFSTRDFVFNDGNYFLKTVHLNDEDMNVVTMANFRTINSDLNPKFPYAGTWYEYFSGDELEVVDTQHKLTFGPGEYRIYLSEPIAPPNGHFSSIKEINKSELTVFPNPSTAGGVVYINVGEWQKVDELNLIHSNGMTYRLNYDQQGTQLSFDLPVVSPGVYFLRLNSGMTNDYIRLVITP